MTITNISAIQTKNPMYVSTMLYLMSEETKQNVNAALTTDIIKTILDNIPTSTPDSKKAEILSNELTKFFTVFEHYKTLHVAISDKPIKDVDFGN